MSTLSYLTILLGKQIMNLKYEAISGLNSGLVSNSGFHPIVNWVYAFFGILNLTWIFSLIWALQLLAAHKTYLNSLSMLTLLYVIWTFAVLCQDRYLGHHTPLSMEKTSVGTAVHYLHFNGCTKFHLLNTTSMHITKFVLYTNFFSHPLTMIIFIRQKHPWISCYLQGGFWRLLLQNFSQSELW